MDIGKNIKIKSPILSAIWDAERDSTGEIRVHLSKRWFEPDPFARALHLFTRFGMSKTSHRNAILIYVNLRKRRFAIIGDAGIHHAVGQNFWESLSRQLRENLLSTHSEKAIALTIQSIGKVLKEHFPTAKSEAV